MPEGDTVFRAAGTLRRALAGATVWGLRSPVPEVAARAPLVAGRTVAAVDPYGKHFLMRFARDGQSALTLHVHLQMEGSWHLYRHGERWRRPPARARAVVETDAFVAPCFDAPTVELLTERELARHRWLGALGPDAMAEDFDAEAAVARLRARPADQIGVALLDQRALAGVGNVHKSEVLFLARLSPFARIRDLDDATLGALAREASALLRANRGGWPRTTRPRARRGEELWAYGRAGKACRRCGARIALRRQGLAGRATYFCPTCQGVG